MPDLARQVQQLSDPAHIWSTCVGRRRLEGSAPFLHGTNSIQLDRESGRWWVAQVAWEQQAYASSIPAQFQRASGEIARSAILRRFATTS